MSRIEELRMLLNFFQTSMRVIKEILSNLNEERKELDPDPEFDADFALKNAEADYYITELEKKIEIIKNEIDELKSQNLDN